MFKGTWLKKFVVAVAKPLYRDVSHSSSNNLHRPLRFLRSGNTCGSIVTMYDGVQQCGNGLRRQREGETMCWRGPRKHPAMMAAAPDFSQFDVDVIANNNEVRFNYTDIEHRQHGGHRR